MGTDDIVMLGDNGLTPSEELTSSLSILDQPNEGEMWTQSQLRKRGRAFETKTVEANTEDCRIELYTLDKCRKENNMVRFSSSAPEISFQYKYDELNFPSATESGTRAFDLVPC